MTTTEKANIQRTQGESHESRDRKGLFVEGKRNLLSVTRGRRQMGQRVNNFREVPLDNVRLLSVAAARPLLEERSSTYFLLYEERIWEEAFGDGHLTDHCDEEKARARYHGSMKAWQENLYDDFIQQRFLAQQLSGI